jgi:hypothetical protein
LLDIHRDLDRLGGAKAGPGTRISCARNIRGFVKAGAHFGQICFES